MKEIYSVEMLDGFRFQIGESSFEEFKRLFEENENLGEITIYFFPSKEDFDSWEGWKSLYSVDISESKDKCMKQFESGQSWAAFMDIVFWEH